ncbi:MAG TPA: DUF5017 domain-containing protein [Sphingobacteriaceae bacterium]
MKLKYLYICLLFVAGLSACEKEQDENLSDFDVKTDATVYKVGEKVTFNLTGNPLQITFYSGEPGRIHEYRSGRVLGVEKLFGSFATNVAYGSQPDLLSVWVSSNFNGKYTIEDIKAATWKNNVSKNFKLAPHSMSSTSASLAVSSGVLDLTGETEPGKPLYFAFRYKKKPDAEAGTQRNWLIRNILIEGSTILGDTPLANGNNFNLVYDENFHPDSTADRTSGISSSGVITLRAPSLPNPIGAKNIEVWAVSKAINTSEVNVGSDLAEPIKGYSNVPIHKHEYVYNTPGTYRVTFVASNKTAEENEEVVKHIDIKIVD